MFDALKLLKYAHRFPMLQNMVIDRAVTFVCSIMKSNRNENLAFPKLVVGSRTE